MLIKKGVAHHLGQLFRSPKAGLASDLLLVMLEWSCKAAKVQSPVTVQVMMRVVFDLVVWLGEMDRRM